MYSKAAHVLVLVFCQGYAQQSETIEPVQSEVVKDIFCQAYAQQAETITLVQN